SSLREDLFWRALLTVSIGSFVQRSHPPLAFLGRLKKWRSPSLAASSACATYQVYASAPPPCRLGSHPFFRRPYSSPAVFVVTPFSVSPKRSPIVVLEVDVALRT